MKFGKFIALGFASYDKFASLNKKSYPKNSNHVTDRTLYDKYFSSYCENREKFNVFQKNPKNIALFRNNSKSICRRAF